MKTRINIHDLMLPRAEWIIFDDKNHTYYNQKTNRFMTPVSTVLSSVSQYFDEKNVSKRMAERDLELMKKPLS